MIVRGSVRSPEDFHSTHKQPCNCVRIFSFGMGRGQVPEPAVPEPAGRKHTSVHKSTFPINMYWLVTRLLHESEHMAAGKRRSLLDNDLLGNLAANCENLTCSKH